MLLQLTTICLQGALEVSLATISVIVSAYVPYFRTVLRLVLFGMCGDIGRAYTFQGKYTC